MKNGGVSMQANAEPDLAQTGERLKPAMAGLISGILDLFLPSMGAGHSSAQVSRQQHLRIAPCYQCRVRRASLGD